MNRINILIIQFVIFYTANAQVSLIDSSKFPKPVQFTAQQDNQNMMQQLGIKKLRPGPSGNESAPNHKL
jgi:hypothetical protein